jgi:hypothetical protein
MLKKFLSDSKEKKKLEILENLDKQIFFIEVLDELELFVAKRVIFDEKKNFRRSAAQWSKSLIYLQKFNI